MQSNIFCRNLLNMEEKKIIKVTTSWGREVTYIVDPTLNGFVDRVKPPKKVVEVNERLRKMKLPK